MRRLPQARVKVQNGTPVFPITISGHRVEAHPACAWTREEEDPTGISDADCPKRIPRESPTTSLGTRRQGFNIGEGKRKWSNFCEF